MNDDQPRSRRGVLAAALGAVAGTVVASVARPEPADATVATMQTGATNAADAETRLYRTNSGPVFSVFSTTMPLFEQGSEIVSAGTNVDNGSAIRAIAEGSSGIGLEGRSTGVSGIGVYGNGASWGVVGDGPLIGVLGRGTAPNSWGVHGSALDSGSTGVFGVAGAGGTAVRGAASGSGNGGQFRSDTGYALDVQGRAHFSRAGRTSVAANHTYVDVTVPGGLASTAFVVATLQLYRSGVYVAAVRPNYPSTGKARIYLNKVASTTSSTPVGWIAFG